MMFDLAEILLAQAKQRRAEKFRVAADIVIGVRMEFVAVLVAPLLFSRLFPFESDGARIPVGFFSRHVAAAFENQNLLARGCKLVSKGAAAGAAADNDRVVVIICRHGDSP